MSTVCDPSASTSQTPKPKRRRPIKIAPPGPSIDDVPRDRLHAYRAAVHAALKASPGAAGKELAVAAWQHYILKGWDHKDPPKSSLAPKGFRLADDTEVTLAPFIGPPAWRAGDECNPPDDYDPRQEGPSVRDVLPSQLDRYKAVIWDIRLLRHGFDDDREPTAAEVAAWPVSAYDADADAEERRIRELAIGQLAMYATAECWPYSPAPADFRLFDEPAEPEPIEPVADLAAAEAPEPVDPEPKPEPVGLVDEPAEAPESPAEPEPVAEVIEQAPALEPADPEPKSEPAGAPVALVAEPGPSPLYVLPARPRGSAVEPDISRPLVDLRSLELVIGGPRIVYSLAADGEPVGDAVDGEWRLYRDAAGSWLRVEVDHYIDDDYGHRRWFSAPPAFAAAVADGLAEARYVDADEVARLLLADRPYLDREAVDAALAALTWSPEPTDDRANAEPVVVVGDQGPTPSSGVPGFDPRPDADAANALPMAAGPVNGQAPRPENQTKASATRTRRKKPGPKPDPERQRLARRIEAAVRLHGSRKLAIAENLPPGMKVAEAARIYESYQRNQRRKRKNAAASDNSTTA